MIIATRELTVICKSGERKPAVLRLEAPVKQDGMWRCSYEIDWPEDDEPPQTRRFYGGGEDAIQALQIGLMMMGIDTLTSRCHREGRLFWTEPGAGLGLVVPANLRDELHGAVSTYYGDY